MNKNYCQQMEAATKERVKKLARFSAKIDAE